MRTSIIPMLGMVLIGSSALSADLSTVGEVAGTYDLIICKSTCSFSDSANVFAKAVVVLLDHEMARKDVERIDPECLDVDCRNEPATGCYSLKKIANAESFAASMRTGITPWRLFGETLEFNLFHTVDAGYVVNLEREGSF